MLSLYENLSVEKIMCGISGDMEKIITDLIALTLKSYSNETKEIAKHTVLNREFFGTTNIGNGFAIAHGRIDNLDKINAGLAILNEKIIHDGDEPVEVVFCLVVPENRNRDYLSLLAHIARVCSHPEAKEVFKCENAEKIIEFLKDIGC